MTPSPSKSLRTLLEGVIDYAGLFPPASLTVEEAVACWRQYRADDAAWMLGRFVCPTNKLADLARLGWTAQDGAISLVGSRDSKTPLADAANAIGAIPHPELVDAIELPPSELSEAVSLPATVYREVALDRLEEAIFRAKVEGFALKFRTGGTTAAAFPTSESLARAIIACRDAGIAWKATAGLHHPLPNTDASGGRAHGFINLLTAAVLVHARRCERRVEPTFISAILQDDRGQAIFFDQNAMSWGYEATLSQIAAARRDAFRSFGSCSFTEPRDDLVKLNWFRSH